MDHAGREFGPDSPQTAEAVRHVDDLVGRLEAKLKELASPIDLFVVSHHGMENIGGNWIDLDHFADLSVFQTEGMLFYSSSESDAENAYEHLKGAGDKFVVCRRRDVLKGLHYDENEREGRSGGGCDGALCDSRSRGESRRHGPKNKGGHGYDPQQFKSMRAICYAIGPDIRPNTTVPAFENVNIYPLIAKILGLDTTPTDGDLKVLAPILPSRQIDKRDW